MSAPGQDHTTRTEYHGLSHALHDAYRVLIDLQALAQGRTVVAAPEFEFLARRARGLIRACIELEDQR